MFTEKKCVYTILIENLIIINYKIQEDLEYLKNNNAGILKIRKKIAIKNNPNWKYFQMFKINDDTLLRTSVISSK